jgi:hypothetical protein
MAYEAMCESIEEAREGGRSVAKRELLRGPSLEVDRDDRRIDLSPLVYASLVKSRDGFCLCI